MSSLQVLTGKNYLSYSSLSTYVRCSEQYKLERVMDAPRLDAWWFVGGKVVHSATEMLDKGESDDPIAAFNEQWELALNDLTERDVDLTTMPAGGRASKAWPNREDHAWWAHNGPPMVVNYHQWRKGIFAQGWQWFMVGDEPAIEVPIEIDFADQQILVKGFIDRALVNPYGELVVMDLKSGSYTPDDALQLATYALGMEETYGVLPTVGYYYMTRTPVVDGPHDLSRYTREVVGGWYGNAKRGIEAEVFIPHVTNMCGRCGVRDYCIAVGGDPSALAKPPAF